MIAIANALSRDTPLGKLHLDKVIGTIQDGLESAVHQTGLDVVASGAVGLLDAGTGVANKSIDIVDMVHDLDSKLESTVMNHVVTNPALGKAGDSVSSDGGQQKSQAAKDGADAYAKHQVGVAGDLEENVKYKHGNPLKQDDEGFTSNPDAAIPVVTVEVAEEPSNVALGLFPEGSPFRLLMVSSTTQANQPRHNFCPRIMSSKWTACGVR